ncbi:MAG TPA: alpha/beta hydrolase [Planctomycetaceae bacterium]|nr:alpha/beta hydrolase [Planctomycetaceae bacterium]HIQ21962.1 alpha/beta hydrolase [Planctomycetota bacterium]
MREKSLAGRLALAALGCFGSVALCGARAAQPEKPRPTFADVRYGPHERNVLDFWQAPSEKPAPLVIFIHGGGFRSGSKEKLDARVLRRLLDAGISVAAINYRLVQNAPLPAAHQDACRAVQFLRSKAEAWNIDKARVGAFGGSAGAQLCMWLAMHDDMADPDSPDPVCRESSRLACVATMGGQTSMHFDWWKKHIPGYAEPHRDLTELFGTSDPTEQHRIATAISALDLVSPDAPPIFMSYGMAPDAPVPSDPRRARGWKVHHVNFGVALKKKMDALGIEAHLKYPGAKTKYASVAEFLIAKLAGRWG